MKVTASVTSSTIEQVRPTRSAVRARETAPAVADTKDAHGYFNKGIGDIDGLRNVKVGPGLLENLVADLKVDGATKGNLRDNDKARELKQDYKKLYDAARDQQRAAQGLADKLGPGEHKLLDGSTVTVTQNKDGSTTVTTTKPDGSKTVAELSQDPSKFKFTNTPKNGLPTTVERDGSTITESNALGGSTRYAVDDNGNAVRTETNRFLDQTVKTHVNDDGSTDTWTYKGRMLPTVEHEPGRIFRPLNGF